MNNNMDMIKYGPMGGHPIVGTVWDEKGKGEIAKIFVSSAVDADFVLSLQFLFVDNGQFVLSQRHGADYNNNWTTTFTTVVLDYPSEFLTGIKGTCYPDGLRSIIFVTNKGTYGPYGGKLPMVIDTEFDIQIGDDRSFGGFHGTKKKEYIESIGLYIKPITSSMITPTTNSGVTKAKRINID